MILILLLRIQPEKGYAQCPAQIDLPLEKELIPQTKNIGDLIKLNESLKNWPSAGQITFNDVYIKYREPLDFALRKLNLKINPNEKVEQKIYSLKKYLFLNKDWCCWKNWCREINSY